MLAGILIVLFGFVVIFGAPYLPTHRRQAEIALDILDLKKGQTLYELGSGDGKVLQLAAQRGLSAVGFELNPVLAVISRLRTWKYRSTVKIVWGDYWSKNWDDADGVYVFLVSRYMKKLDRKMNKSKKPKRLVSYAFQIPNKKAIKSKDGLFLYTYK